MEGKKFVCEKRGAVIRRMKTILAQMKQDLDKKKEREKKDLAVATGKFVIFSLFFFKDRDNWASAKVNAKCSFLCFG